MIGDPIEQTGWDMRVMWPALAAADIGALNAAVDSPYSQ